MWANFVHDKLKVKCYDTVECYSANNTMYHTIKKLNAQKNLYILSVQLCHLLLYYLKFSSCSIKCYLTNTNAILTFIPVEQH